MSAFRVSVIIPVYNAEKFLEHAVESALQQPEVGEVILVDDGSIDKSFEIAQELVDEHPDRVLLFWHEGKANRGPGASRNLGLSKASCAYISFLDADDWYVSNCFSFGKTAFECEPDLGMIRHSLGNGWDSNDSKQSWFIGYAGENKAKSKFHSTAAGVDAHNYFTSLYPMGGVSSGIAGILLIRREIAVDVGGFPDRMWAEDTTFHLKLAAIAKVGIAPVDPPMAMRRIHANNHTRGMVALSGARIDMTGEALLDAASFIKFRQLMNLSKAAALHRGWLRFARQYNRHRSYAMIKELPLGLLNPRIAIRYATLYCKMLLTVLAQQAKVK